MTPMQWQMWKHDDKMRGSSREAELFTFSCIFYLARDNSSRGRKKMGIEGIELAYH